jgi:ABC-type Fe3+ transport system substrate-binding protein
MIGTAGCSSGSGESIRLVLISPHRDEIRQEVALGFQDWFRERTEGRVASAAESLKDEKVTPASIRAFEQLFADWRPDDQRELRAAYDAWQKSPTPANAKTLSSALDSWSHGIPAVDLIWQDVGGGTSQMARYISARFEASRDGIGIDLLFGGGTDIFIRFARQELLQGIELPAAVLERIRPELNGVPLYDARRRWFGPVVSSFGILYNRRVLERIGQPEPEGRQGWSFLSRPELQGWVAAGDPRLTGSVHMVYEIILQGKGWNEGFSLLLRLGANTHSFIRDSGTLTRTVIAGEVAAAGNLDANALSAVGRYPAMMGFHLPSGETITNPDAIAMLKGAPRPELARAFVEFTLSDACQRLFLLRPGIPGGPRHHALCRLSVVEDLYRRHPPEERSVGDANPFAISKSLAYKSKVGDDRWDALNDLFGAVIVDAHPDLSAAWRALLKLSPGERRSELERELFQPPCSERDLAEHGQRIREGSPRARNETVNGWGESARRRYGEVRRRADQGS